MLERRVAALEGGLEALCVSTGQAAVNYAALNVAELGSNLVSVPQLYGTTHTLFAHVFPSQGLTVRFAESEQSDAIEKLIDDKTRAVFCESVGNPAGNICDVEALARVAHKHGVPQGYFDEQTADALIPMRERASSDPREELLADFPAAAGNVTNTWRSAAAGVYRNWLLHLRAQKDRRLRGTARPKGR